MFSQPEPQCTAGTHTLTTTGNTQKQITNWTVFHPFISGVSSFPWPHYPFGTPIPTIDPTQILWICMQNTQFSFKIQGDNLDISNIINHLQQLDTQMFFAISPNINWQNQINWIKTKCLFCWLSPHIHLSAMFSEISKDPDYFHKDLIGGYAIITAGLWASKVSATTTDGSGLGTFTITTIQGKNNNTYPSSRCI